MYAEELHIYQLINYTEKVGHCMQKRYIYIPINQLHRGSKTVYREEVPIYTNVSNIQRRYDSVYRRGTYIYQSINYTEEVRQYIHKRYLYIPMIQIHRGSKKGHTEKVPILTNQSITQKR